VTVQSRNQTAPAGVGGHQPASLGDILERVLDRGVVIVGDIRVSLLDIELLTIKLRLLIASVDTARELGIDWWEHDPWLTSRAREPLEDGNGHPRTAAVGDGRRDDRPAEVAAGEAPIIDVDPVPRRHREAERHGHAPDESDE
jgi:Gas vesicle protein